MEEKATRTYIDMDTWKRKSAFFNFFGTDLPYLNVGAELDVTNLYNFTKQNHLSFYFALTYLANTTADSIINYRYRFEDGKAFEIGHNTAFVTYLRKGEENYFMVECKDSPSLTEFCQINYSRANNPLTIDVMPVLKGRLDVICYTCLPWVNYTHIFRTIAQNGIDCNPKISWGKFYKRDNHIYVNFSNQTHHGLMDGYHVGQYYIKMQEHLDNADWK